MLGMILFLIILTIILMAVILVGLNYNKRKISKLPILSPTFRFVNGTFAIVTIMNSGHYKIFAGQFKNSNSKTVSKQLLKNYWDITNKENGLETVEALVEGMHSTDYLAMIEANSTNELSQTTDRKDESNSQTLYEAYKDFGEKAILGWDLSRANEILSRLYLSDYIDKDTYIDKTIVVSKRIQSAFSSWDDFIKSYMYGYQYWSHDNPKVDSKKPKNYQQRERVINLMKNDLNSPLHLDWNTPLKKD
ncbi:DUF1266 domain-containing protein [Lacrimispora brassicae]